MFSWLDAFVYEIPFCVSFEMSVFTFGVQLF
jgi:hypothetical protein